MDVGHFRFVMVFLLRWGCLWGCLAELVLPAHAVEIPPTGSVAFIQTTGPNGALSNGDYYTSTLGGATNHRFVVFVPCGLPAGIPITFTLYDPEVAGPNPLAPNPPALDEIRPNAAPLADDTVFTLLAPGGATVGPVVYAPGGGTNGLWVELLTITPDTPGYGCGQYVLTVTVSDDDENAWRLRASFDPDCTPSVPLPGTCSGIGAAQSALMGNSNSQDDLDGIPGTGDELVIGVARTSYQHSALACQDFYFFVSAQAPLVTINNFDMDGGQSVRYFPPATSQYAPFVNGTVSTDNRWNGGLPPPPFPPQRVGDAFAIELPDVGFWRAELCADVSNQYIFEGIENQLVFFNPPPFPDMRLEKTDGITFIGGSGQVVTYTLSYRNVGSGAALNVVLTDVLPVTAAFQSCTGGCIPGNPITWNLGTVPAGASGSVSITALLAPVEENQPVVNVARLTFSDLLSNNYGPVIATDINFGTGFVTPLPPATPGPPSTPTPANFDGDGAVGGAGSATGGATGGAGSTGGGLTLRSAASLPLVFRSSAYIAKGVFPGFALPGTQVQWVIRVRNPGGRLLTNIKVVDSMPAETTVESVLASSGRVQVSANALTWMLEQLAAGSQAELIVTSRVSASAPPPYFAKNQACLTSEALLQQECAFAVLSSVSVLPVTGLSPWSAWRLPLALLAAGGIAALGLLHRRPKASASP